MTLLCRSLRARSARSTRGPIRGRRSQRSAAPVSRLPALCETVYKCVRACVSNQRVPPHSTSESHLLRVFPPATLINCKVPHRIWPKTKNALVHLSPSFRGGSLMKRYRLPAEENDSNKRFFECDKLCSCFCCCLCRRDTLELCGCLCDSFCANWSLVLQFAPHKLRICFKNGRQMQAARHGAFYEV